MPDLHGRKPGDPGTGRDRSGTKRTGQEPEPAPPQSETPDPAGPSGSREDEGSPVSDELFLTEPERTDTALNLTDTIPIEVPPVLEGTGSAGGPPSPGIKRMGYMRSSGLLIGTTLAARLMGFLRDVVIADKFGAVGTTDAYFVANLLPNFLNGVLQGALSSVVVPSVSADFAGGDAKRAYRLLFGLSALLGWAILALVLLVSFATYPLVHIMAPGLHPGEVLVAVHLTRILVWTVAFGAYAYLGAAALQAQERFVYMSLGPICMSGSATLVLLAVHHPPIVLLAIGLLIGNALQFLLQVLPHLKWRLQFPRWSEIAPRGAEVKTLTRRAWPALISSSVGQVNAIVDRFFGSFLPVGSITEVTFANRIVQVPLGVFGYAVSNASYPEMARAYTEGRVDHVNGLMLRDMRMILLLSVPLTGLFVALAGPIVSAVYRHGHLDTAMANVIVFTFLYYTGSLIPFSVRTVVNRGFFLTGKTRILAQISVVFVILNAAGDAIFSKLIGAPGLALGTTIDQWISIVITIYYLRRSMNLVPMRDSLDAFVRAIVATIPLSLAALGARFYAIHLMGPVAASTVGRILVVLIAGLVGLVVGVVAFWVVRYPSLDQVAARLRRRLRRR